MQCMRYGSNGMRDGELNIKWNGNGPRLVKHLSAKPKDDAMHM